MGTMLGNLHIRCTDKQSVLRAVLATGDKQTYQYIGDVENGWIAVLGDQGVGDTTTGAGQTLSEQIAAPVLSVGLFDDDVLTIALSEHGSVLTEFTAYSYEGLRGDYEWDGKKSVPMDFKLFAECLGVLELDLRRALREYVNGEEFQDLETIVSRLSVLLGVELWVKADWLENGVDVHTKLKFEPVIWPK